MDPFRLAALQNAKSRSLFHSTQQATTTSTTSDDMPAPPAYHMVVDPNAPVPNIASPYDPQTEEEEKDEDDMPEITINAATQIRGNGNIISIAQMDTARIANLIALMLHGVKGPEVVASPTQAHPQSPPTTPTTHEPTLTPTRKQLSTSSINITVNCGATIIGDRNIVGPGLGDIARQMQLAQRNQALHAQQQAQQQQQQQQEQKAQEAQHHHQQSPPSIKVPMSDQRRETLYQAQAAIAQHHGTMYAAQGLMSLHAPTPPMSRSSSLGSDGSCGVKRKAEGGDAGDVVPKRQC